MNPTLTSSSGSGQNEQVRINRLEKVLKIYNIQIEELNDQELSEIISLHDHKGELSITWNNEPTDEQKSITGQIWQLQNELGENVVHKLEETKE